MCESGKGRVLRTNKGKLEEFVNLGSFTRGMIAYKDKVIVATSLKRESTSNKVPPENIPENRCGIHLIDKSGKVLDSIFFDDGEEEQNKQEIFDIQLIPQRHTICSHGADIYPFLHAL